MPNRLADSRSPYLRQHSENPVDWYPWGEEAFARAREEDKPVLLSVGYSACHWCHVMAHESFENAAVGELLNQNFISIKVDREERPDVDEAYMTAVQLSSGRGGWPMTVFMTPDKKPFFAGTYFPLEDRGGYPGFRSLVIQIAAAWKDARVEVDHAAHEFASALAQTIERDAPAGTLSPDLIDRAVKALEDDFDEEHGGFGFAPKFPPHSALALLIATGHVKMAEKTIEAMIRGGIHDHIGGGFHRYSTDERWLLPHFEKMLYDNALLLDVMSSICDPDFRVELGVELHHPVNGIINWLGREMTSPEGLFYSALDADSEGEEGKFYVWSYKEAKELEGEEFCRMYDIRPEGNFHDESTRQPTGLNIPNRILREGMPDAEWIFPPWFVTRTYPLREVRDRRVHPGLDDKIIVGWNALMIAALAKAGQIDKAIRAAEEILKHDPLPRIIGSGDSGFLEDYAAMALACFTLDERINTAFALPLSMFTNPDIVASIPPRVEAPHSDQMPIDDSEFALDPQATESVRTTDLRWRLAGARLVHEMLDRFAALEGGFYATSDGHENLFGRSIPVTDSPIPSANSLALRALLRHDPEHPHLEKSFRRLAGWMERAPTACEGLVLAYWEYLNLSREKGVKPIAVTLRAEETENGRNLIIDIPPDITISGGHPTDLWRVPLWVNLYPEAEATLPPGNSYQGTVIIPIPPETRHASILYQACTETECYIPASASVHIDDNPM